MASRYCEYWRIHWKSLYLLDKPFFNEPMLRPRIEDLSSCFMLSRLAPALASGCVSGAGGCSMP